MVFTTRIFCTFCFWLTNFANRRAFLQNQYNVLSNQNTILHMSMIPFQWPIDRATEGSNNEKWANELCHMYVTDMFHLARLLWFLGDCRKRTQAFLINTNKPCNPSFFLPDYFGESSSNFSHTCHRKNILLWSVFLNTLTTLASSCWFPETERQEYCAPCVRK